MSTLNKQDSFSYWEMKMRQCDRKWPDLGIASSRVIRKGWHLAKICMIWKGVSLVLSWGKTIWAERTACAKALAGRNWWIAEERWSVCLALNQQVEVEWVSGRDQMRYRSVSHKRSLNFIQRMIGEFSAEEYYALIYIFLMIKNIHTVALYQS